VVIENLRVAFNVGGKGGRWVEWHKVNRNMKFFFKLRSKREKALVGQALDR